MMKIGRIRRFAIGALAATSLATGGSLVAAGTASAGTNGQQVVVENVNSPATAVEVCGTNQNNVYVCHRRDLRSTWMGSCDQWLVVEGDCLCVHERGHHLHVQRAD